MAIMLATIQVVRANPPRPMAPISGRTSNPVLDASVALRSPTCCLPGRVRSIPCSASWAAIVGVLLVLGRSEDDTVAATPARTSGAPVPLQLRNIPAGGSPPGSGRANPRPWSDRDCVARDADALLTRHDRHG